MKYLVTFIVTFFSFQAIAQPAVADFFGETINDVTISPDGNYIAFIQDEGDIGAITVLSTSDFSLYSNTNFGNGLKIDEIFWVNNNRIVFSPLRYGSTLSGELFGVDIDGSDFKVLYSSWASDTSSNGQIGTSERSERDAWAEIIDFLPEEEDYVLIHILGYSEDEFRNSAWKMNVNTGRLAKVQNSPIPNGSFITDYNHEIRFVTGTNYEDVEHLYYLDEEDEWELIAVDTNIDEWVSVKEAYDDEGNFLVLNTDTNGMLGYSIWNPVSREMQDVFHHDEVDVWGRYQDNNSTSWAFGFVNHYPDYFYLNSEHPFVNLHRELRRTMPTQDVQLLDSSDDQSKVVIYVASPQNVGEYIIVDTVAMSYLYRIPVYPGDALNSLSPMEPFEFEARDGLNIRGYLTTPSNSDDSPLPMVVLLRNDPFLTYNSWGYHARVQTLASKGYAVLQVNYRGSPGRGRLFAEAGKGDWGGGMQTDISDAVRWAIADGVADPENICIYGFEYGAFAALSATFVDPEMFKCAVGVVGEYDLSLKKSLDGRISNGFDRFDFEKEVLSDLTQIDSRSPVEQAEFITAKIMLLYSDPDDEPTMQHALRMKDALESEGHDVEWLNIFGPEPLYHSFEKTINFINNNIGE